MLKAVKNLKGSSRLNGEFQTSEYSDYATYMDFWIAQKGGEPVECANLYCLHKKFADPELVGAHVFDAQGNIYITPLCQKCNHCTNTGEMRIFEDNLAKLSVEETIAIKRKLRFSTSSTN